MERILIDCDPGHDDAIAICLAMAHEDKLKIEGITTVGGNQTIDNVTRNALKIVELLEADIDVAMGADKPLIRELRTGAEAHGATGMDGPILPEPSMAVVDKFAVEYLAEKLRTADEPLTIVALGPLTNIALLLRTYPDVSKKIRRISLMGGGLYTGNVTSAAEFNIYVDPEAASIVFQSDVSIIMSGLDVTNKSFIKRSEFEPLYHKGKVSNFVAELLEFYFRYSEENGFPGGAMHDACAVMYLLEPEMFEVQEHHIDVYTTNDLSRGMTKADARINGCKENMVSVLMDVDREGFVDELLASVMKLD